jgi:hypothetical protein
MTVEARSRSSSDRLMFSTMFMSLEALDQTDWKS